MDLAPSNYQRVTQTQLENGYPLGLHFELATLRQVLGIGVDEAYQPFIALSIALAALPAARLLEAIGIPRLLACAGGAVALVAYLPYSYALQGGIKEMGMICFILLGAALARGGGQRSATRSATRSCSASWSRRPSRSTASAGCPGSA